MEYKQIQLKVTDNGIDTYKSFQGIKIFSQSKSVPDGKSLVSQRIYQTQKGNYVYYERTDVNWNAWNDLSKYDTDFVPNSYKSSIIFEVFPDLNGISKYLDKEILEKVKTKMEKGGVVEYLDI